MELAIYEDCLSLVNNFADDENANFKTFCEKWKSMSFQHIYSAQTSVVEIVQTTKTILHLCKRIVCAKDNFGKIVSNIKNKKQVLRRIGGFFLMYCIYFKQPTKEYVKINVSAVTWLDIINFVKTLPQNTTQIEEVGYIFWKLYKNDAFRFTALDYEVGLEDLIDYDGLYDTQNNTADVVRVKLKQKLSIINETEKILPKLIKIEDNYNTSKNSLIECNKTDRQKIECNNTLPATTIFHDIQDALKNIHNMLEKEHSIEIETGSEETKCQKRREIKRKAAGQSKNYEIERVPIAKDTKVDVGRYCGRLTVRQLMNQNLPQDLLDDLKNSSSEDEKNINLVIKPRKAD